MTDHYDVLETRELAVREADLFARLPDVLHAAMQAPAYAEHLKGIDPSAVKDRAALAILPVLRKSELPSLHKADDGDDVTALDAHLGHAEREVADAILIVIRAAFRP